MVKHPFNHPDDIAQSLKIFKKKDWRGKVFQDIIDAYRSAFETIPVFTKSVKKGTILFRARPNEEGLFKGVSEIGINPRENVKSFGRAHIPGQPVFYCSTNEETAVQEVTQWYINDSGRAQDLFTKKVINRNWSPFTSMMTISAWLVKEDLNLALLFGVDHKKRSLTIGEYEANRYNVGIDENDDYVKSRNLIIDFFSEEFGKTKVKHHSDYFYSSYYAFEIYNSEITEKQPLKLDGVQYASIANNIRGENIALGESAYESKLQFLGANSCYTYNNNISTVESNCTAVIGKLNTAILKNDNTFNWIESTNDYDYIIKLENTYQPLFLASADSRIPVIRT